nr:MAG TPA: hypothetical protein [Caudoviricetes sp.]
MRKCDSFFITHSSQGAGVRSVPVRMLAGIPSMMVVSVPLPFL